MEDKLGLKTTLTIIFAIMIIEGFLALINKSVIEFFLGKIIESLKIIEITIGTIGLIGLVIGLVKWFK